MELSLSSENTSRSTSEYAVHLHVAASQYPGQVQIISIRISASSTAYGLDGPGIDSWWG